ncbi:head-to-tail stopper [Arthrobacter phage Snek]|uniref:Head-to-tail stopper n=1 Tax=Arthrobacter phage Tweety19 TaxID=2768133 RepID=A0A7G9W208_9CAUD|nr:head closure Hc1 [Arthrobacter phage Tweety19]QNO12671.1 head-to-tail stopper [Arthrobacter phage Tweety19]
MLLSSPGPKTPVYRLRAVAALDSYGDPIESWAAPAKTRLFGARVQDTKTDEEDSTGRRIVRGEKTLFAPGVADLTEDDRIEYEGQIWRVNGVPSVRRGLGSLSFTTAYLTRSS